MVNFEMVNFEMVSFDTVGSSYWATANTFLTTAAARYSCGKTAFPDAKLLSGQALLEIHSESKRLGFHLTRIAMTNPFQSIPERLRGETRAEYQEFWSRSGWKSRGLPLKP